MGYNFNELLFNKSKYKERKNRLNIVLDTDDELKKALNEEIILQYHLLEGQMKQPDAGKRRIEKFFEEEYNKMQQWHDESAYSIIIDME